MHVNLTQGCSVPTAQGFSRLDDSEGLGVGNIKREDLDIVLNLLGEKKLLSKKGREHLYALFLSLARARYLVMCSRYRFAYLDWEMTLHCAADMCGLTTPSRWA